VFHVVFDIVLARIDQPPLSFRVTCRQELLFTCGVAGALENEVLAVASASRSNVEAFIGLFVYKHVFRMQSSEPMAVELKLALLLLVLDGIEEGPIVGSPDDGANALDSLGQKLACAQILDLEGVLAKPLVVDRICEQVAIVRNSAPTDGHKRLPLSQLVYIEDDLFGSARVGSVFRRKGGAWLAAKDWILRTLLGPGVVPVLALAKGHRDVGLLDMADHLSVESLLEFGCGLKDSSGIGVFRLEVGDDLGVVALAKPGVVVDQRVAVNCGFGTTGNCDGGNGQSLRGHNSSAYRF
jgi:hypothetical protein